MLRQHVLDEARRAGVPLQTRDTGNQIRELFRTYYPNLPYEALRTDVALHEAGADELFPLLNDPIAGNRLDDIRQTYAHTHRLSAEQQQDLRNVMILNRLTTGGERSEVSQQTLAVSRGGYNAMIAAMAPQMNTPGNGGYVPSTRVAAMHGDTYRQTFNRGDGYRGPQDNGVLATSQTASAIATAMHEAEEHGYRADILHMRIQAADRPNSKSWASIAIPRDATLEQLMDLIEEAVRVWQDSVEDRERSLQSQAFLGTLPPGARERMEKYAVFQNQDIDIDLTQFAITFRPEHAAPGIIPPGELLGLNDAEIKYMRSVSWELRTTLYGEYMYKSIACPEGYVCIFYAAAIAKGVQYETIYRQFKHMLPLTNDNLIAFCSANRVGFNMYVFGENADGQECVRLQKAAQGSYNKIYDAIVKPDPRTGINHIELLIDTNGIKVTEEIQEDARRNMHSCIKIIRAQESQFSAPIYICFDTETVWLYDNGCIVPYGAQLFMRNPDDIQNLKRFTFMVEGPNNTKVEKSVYAHKRIIFTAPDPVKDNHLVYDDGSEYMKCNGTNIIKEAFAEIRKFVFECEQWRIKAQKYLVNHICPCRMMPYQPIVMTWNGSRFDNQIFIQYALADLEPTACLYDVTTFVAARDILRLKVDNITFVDVCKLFPGKLAQVAADFGLPVQKGEMDHLDVQRQYEEDCIKKTDHMTDYLRSEKYRSYAFRDVILVYQIFHKLDAMLRPLQSLKTKNYNIWDLPRTKTKAIQSELDGLSLRKREIARRSKQLKGAKEELERSAEIDMAAKKDIAKQEAFLKECRAQLRAEKERIDEEDAATNMESKMVKMLRRMVKCHRRCPQCAVASIERRGSHLQVKFRKRLFEYMTAGQFSFQEMVAHMQKDYAARLPIFHTVVADEYKEFVKGKTTQELKDIEATVLEGLLRKMQVAGRSDIWHTIIYEDDRVRSLDERSQYVRPCLDELFPIGDADYIDYRTADAQEHQMLIPEHIHPLIYTYDEVNFVDKRYWHIADETEVRLGIYHVIVLEQPDFIAFAVRTNEGLEWSKPERPGIQVVSSIGIMAGVKCGCKILIGDGLAFKETAAACKPFMEKYYQLKVEEDVKKVKGQPFNSSKRALGKAIILIPTGKMAQKSHDASMELILGREKAEKKVGQLRERYGPTNVKDPEEFGHDMFIVGYRKNGLAGSGKPHLYTNLIYEWARFGLILKVLMHIPYSELLCMETDGVIFTDTGYRAAMQHKEFRAGLADTPEMRPGVMTDDTTKDIIDAGCKWFVKKHTFWNILTKTWWNGDDTGSDVYTPGSIWSIDTFTYWVNGQDTHMRAPCWIGCGKKCYALYALNVLTGEREQLKMRFKGVTANCDKCKGDARTHCQHITQVVKESIVGKILERAHGKVLDSDLINSLPYREQTELFRDETIMEPFELKHYFQFLHNKALTIVTSHIKRASPFATDHQQWLRNYYTSKTLVIEPKKKVEHSVTAMTDMNRLWIGFKCIEQRAQLKLAQKAKKEEAETQMIADAQVKPPPEEWL